MALLGSTDQLVIALDHWVESKFKSKRQNKNNKRGQGNTNRHYNQAKGGSGKRASEYKKAQDLYAKNRSGLAEIVLDGRSTYESPELPSLGEVEDLFGGIWESEAVTDDGVISDPKVAQKETFYPISPYDVGTWKAHWQPSAPGPDGITVTDVKKFDNLELSIVFTVVFGSKVHPTTWKQSRTVLVPKDGDKRKANNYRPITIGSALQRLLHRIVQGRIGEAVRLNHHQRGFVKMDGTLANCLILDHYIGSRKDAGKNYNVLSVDLRKAFDSVHHSSILRGLKRVGLEGNS
nr:unnamed protein product [Callosobruchus chinensis]